MAEVFVVRERIEQIERELREIRDREGLKTFCRQAAKDALGETSDQVQGEMQVALGVAKARLEEEKYDLETQLVVLHEKLESSMWRHAETLSQQAELRHQIKWIKFYLKIVAGLAIGTVLYPLIEILISLM